LPIQVFYYKLAVPKLVFYLKNLTGKFLVFFTNVENFAAIIKANYFSNDKLISDVICPAGNILGKKA